MVQQPRAHVVPLAEETRDVLPTADAAFHLNRRPQTLRCWAMDEAAPLGPVRIFGRLGWRTADIRRLVEAKEVA